MMTVLAIASIELRDLDAQLRMAQAAERMLDLTWWQLSLGVVGTLFLLLTLRETRRSTIAALHAVRAQQESERAVLVLQEARSLGIEARSGRDKAREDGVLAASVDVKNVGATLALITSYEICLLVGYGLPPTPAWSGITRSHHRPLAAGGKLPLKAQFRLTRGALRKWEEGLARAWLYGFVRYEDVFKRDHRLAFCYTFSHEEDIREDGGPAYWRGLLQRRPGLLTRLRSALNDDPS